MHMVTIQNPFDRYLTFFALYNLKKQWWLLLKTEVLRRIRDDIASDNVNNMLIDTIDKSFTI